MEGAKAAHTVASVLLYDCLQPIYALDLLLMKLRSLLVRDRTILTFMQPLYRTTSKRERYKCDFESYC